MRLAANFSPRRSWVGVPIWVQVQGTYSSMGVHGRLKSPTHPPARPPAIAAIRAHSHLRPPRRSAPRRRSRSPPSVAPTYGDSFGFWVPVRFGAGVIFHVLGVSGVGQVFYLGFGSGAFLLHPTLNRPVVRPNCRNWVALSLGIWYCSVKH